MRFHPGLLILLPAVLAACGGGGGGGGATVVPTQAPATPTPVPTTAAVSIPVGAASSTTSLGSVASESATLGLAAASSGSGSATAQLALTAPAGAPTLQSATRLPRAIGTTNLTALLFIALTPTATLSFPSTPSFTFTFPSGFALAAGTAAYIAEYDPTQPSAGWQPFLGPGTLSGTTIAFAAVSRSVTFQANQTYLFVLFTTGAVIGVPTAAPSPTPTPTPTATPTSKASATPTPTPTASSSATVSAFACPTGDGTSGFAQAPAVASEAVRHAARHSRSGGATNLLAVSYERSTALGNTRSIAARESALGATVVHTLDFPHSHRYTRVIAVPADQAASIAAMLRSQAGVQSVSRTGERRSPLTVTHGYFPPTADPYFAGFIGTGPPYYTLAGTPGQWDMHAIGLEYAFAYSQANNGSTKTNAAALGSPSVKLAIIDTGQDTLHPELAGKFVAQGCFITDLHNNQSHSNFTTDPDGHGTNVSGIAAAALGNGLGFTGAGGNVSLVGYRVFPTPDDSCLNDNTSDAQCGADTQDIAAAINDAVNVQHVNVISMSLGGGGCTNGVDSDSVEQAAITEAIAANVIVVAASGNDGLGSVSAPACDSGVIAVGASALADGQPNGAGNSNGTAGTPIEYVASYSNYGSPGANLHNTAAWGIVAPGGDPSGNTDNDDLHWIENIWTSTPFDANFAGSCTGDFGGGTVHDCRTLIAGTSMATPHVAGAAALILSVNAAAYGTPAAMKQLLCSTADTINDTHQGCGRLNVYRAMATALGDSPLP